MFTRPSLRAVLATTGAAALLVGGANLASYAATHHGHGGSAKASASKTTVFTLGSPGQKFAGNTAHLFTAKVPKGTYQMTMSGIAVDSAASDTDNVTCVFVDQKTLTHLLHSSGSLKGGQRLYALLSSQGTDSNFGFINQTNPAAKVDRPNIVYGCTFNGTGPFQVVRPLQFTMTPVKATKGKSTGKYHLPATKVRDLARALR
jgi:hypothetical protein